MVEGNIGLHFGLFRREVSSELRGGVGLTLQVGRGSCCISVGLGGAVGPVGGERDPARIQLISSTLILVSQVFNVLTDLAVHLRQGRLCFLFRKRFIIPNSEDIVGEQPCFREVGLLMAGDLLVSAILLVELSGDRVKYH